MKQIWKKSAALLLALSLAAASFGGCAESPEENSSDLSSNSSVTSSSELEEDPVDYSQFLTEEGYFGGIKALDFVTLPDYQKMDIPAEVVDITDNAVQKEVDSLMDSYKETADGESSTPELTDEFVAEKLQEEYGWSTVSAMREGLRTQLRKTAVKEYVWGQIQEKTKVKEIPQEVEGYYLYNMTNYYQSLADQANMELYDYLKEWMGMDVDSAEDLKEKNKEQLQANAASGLILQALCEEKEIHPTEDDVKAYFKKRVGTEDYSTYEERYGKPYVMLMVRESMAMESLGDLA